MSEVEGQRFCVVINREEQYSIWPEGRALPLNWERTGPCGTKEECLAYIDKVWIRFRPLSLRAQVEEQLRKEEEARRQNGG